MKHLSFFLMASLCLTLAACGNNVGKKADAPVPGTDGNKYVPYDQRTGDEGLKPFVAE